MNESIIHGECIIHPGWKKPTGYAQVKHNGTKMHAHRKAWIVAFGPIPKGLDVCHRCDNPPCINLDHLWIGTHAENMADAARKNRMVSPKGSKQHASKLVETDIPFIRSLSGNMRQVDIAAAYGVSQQVISKVINRKHWRHVK